MKLYDEIFLAVIVSLDTYLASVAYCNSGIKIPLPSMIVISFISAFVLGISLEFSDFIGRFVPAEICHICGTIIISAIGIMTIFKSIIRSITGHISRKGEVSVRSGKYGIVLKLYLDERRWRLKNGFHYVLCRLFCHVGRVVIHVLTGNLAIYTTGITAQCRHNHVQRGKIT